MKVFKSMIGNRERPQDVFTPPEILTRVEAVFGGQITTDPCWHPDCLVEAKFTYTEAEDGLVPGRWRGKVYCNPPFRDLQKWLAVATEARKYYEELILLMPNRMHRRWQRDYLGDLVDVVCYLNYNVRFVGWKDAFPQSLMLAYSGPNRYEFGNVMSDIGGVLYGLNFQEVA